MVRSGSSILSAGTVADSNPTNAQSVSVAALASAQQMTFESAVLEQQAQAAAGEIHSDIQRGFIRAEVVAYDALIARGTMAACRDHGQVPSWCG